MDQGKIQWQVNYENRPMRTEKHVKLWENQMTNDNWVEWKSGRVHSILECYLTFDITVMAWKLRLSLTFKLYFISTDLIYNITT